MFSKVFHTVSLSIYITKQSTVVIFVKQSSNTDLEATVFVYPF